MNIRNLLFIPVFALASCSPPLPPPVQQPAPVSPPEVVAAPPPVERQTAEWTDWVLAPGDWVYRRDERGSIALFGPPGQNATLTLRCDQQRRRIYLAREGVSAGGKMRIRSSSAMKEFAASPTGGSPAYLASEIMPNDPILDAMAFSRGRIAIETDGQQPIAVPSWVEITRITEDCRG